MANYQFFSDTNLDGFLQSIAQIDPDADINYGSRVVTTKDSDQIANICNSWDGEEV